MKSPALYRRRLIPDECIPLKDDIILECTSERIVTSQGTAPQEGSSSRLFLLFSQGGDQGQ